MPGSEIEQISEKQEMVRKAFERWDDAAGMLKSAIRLADQEPDFLPVARQRLAKAEAELAGVLESKE